MFFYVSSMDAHRARLGTPKTRKPSALDADGRSKRDELFYLVLRESRTASIRSPNAPAIDATAKVRTTTVNIFAMTLLTDLHCRSTG